MLLTYFLQNGILRLIISIPLNTVYFVELSVLRICCGTRSVSNNTFFYPSFNTPLHQYYRFIVAL